MKAVVMGSTGYAGMTLLRILASHPEVTSIVPVSRSAAGRLVREVDPGLGQQIDGSLAATSGRYVAPDEAGAESADVLFSALPHGAAAELLGPYAGSVPIVDLSADFRISDAERYESIYKVKHPYPELVPNAVYGLTEWHRDAIATAPIIACPGCYPTAALLPLLPFADVVRWPAVVNALSGISGAGRKEKQDLLYNERSENMNAYNPGRVHRHVPEIEQELAAAVSAGAGSPAILFTPHLVPVKQGMFTTIVAELTTLITQAEAEERIRSAYRGSAFVALSPRGIPQTRDVRNTNRCDLGVAVHESHVEIFSALDNLWKGAAGQGVQNMNIRLGFAETLGLRAHGEF
ncbi:MAG: N-acetyl-gamma-glutamyl-phosphate reductase [Spirochaetota bacterium]